MITIVRGEIVGGVRLASRLGEQESGHTVIRCLKKLERVGEGFRGRVLDSSPNGRIGFVFPSSEEACLAAIEMQRRSADLPAVAGIKLNLRLALLSAPTEEQAAQGVGKILGLSLPNQILCDRKTLLEVAANVGLKVRDLHQQINLANGKETAHIMELIWHEGDEELPTTLTSTMLLSQEFTADENPHTQPGVPGAARLRVQYGDKKIILDERTPFVTLGREYHNDFAIDDSRISRQHARIERKGGHYCLVDMSTNGTFVKLSSSPEVFLRKNSMPLRGSGKVCLGASSRDPDAKMLEFEYL
ncbi:hypothetical protein AGMMS49545_07710 [Betaproteobacteria bacterium]|nr:hypothetical protein AGMMS49545_07710 [Betaproteobacteria bacterium]GHU42717.1 hypothetical protein AGMMS50289_07890 [Betaproteobacteria bacterium]